MSIDDKDRRIISLLRKDGRASVRQLAKSAGMRPSTVHQRLGRLKKAGIITGFSARIDDAAVGEGFTAFMLVSSKKDLPQSFFQSVHIKEAFGITGEYDLLLKLKFENVAQFNSFLIASRHGKELAKTLTMVSTIKLKEEL